MARDLRLLKLTLRNFKGLRHFELAPAGGDVSVFGDNATGKTTLADAWFWLLFGKDSSNRKDFEIKTLDERGQPIHHLDHEVEGVLEVDGRQITLKKVYREKWTKKRGSATAEFTGHTVDHFVDGVPVQQKEYQERVAALIDEDTFRLLTDPRFFNEQLHWQERRKILLQVCGDVSDAEVIASSDALAELPEILGHRTIEEHRKVIAERRKRINQELERIPVRIDEATRALPEAEGDRNAIQAEIERLADQRHALQAELARIDHGAQVTELQRQVAQKEIEIMRLRQSLEAETDRAVRAERAKLDDVTERADALRREVRRLQSESRDAERMAESIQAKLASLRTAWYAIRDRQPTLSIDESCPTCGQALPADQVETARQRALEEFNTRKAADLEANVAEGKALKAQLDDLQEEQERRARQIEAKEAEALRLDEQAAAIQERIAQLRQAAPDPSQHPEYQRLAAEKAELQRQIDELRESSAGVKAAVMEEIAKLDGQISALRQEVARIDQRQTLLARIEELKAQERQLASEFEELERQLYLTEEFIRAKVRLLEDRINSRFRLARFKLFDVQVNGGLSETCETMAAAGPGEPLVPYSDLNSGARLNVGLDIIRTLSQHYGFSAPIWVDNAEAVTRLIPVDSQVIRLVVSEPDKALRVVVHDDTRVLTKEAV